MLIKFKVLISLVLLLIATNMEAFVKNSNNLVAKEKNPISVEQFLDLTPESYEAVTGKKLNWGQRISFKAVQKRMRKQLDKGKIQSLDIANEEQKIHVLSQISYLFAGLTILSLFFFLIADFLFLVSLFMSVLGLVFSILGFKKSDKVAKSRIAIIINYVIALLAFITTSIILYIALMNGI